MRTEPMDVVVRQWVVEALVDHPDLIALSVRQRAKWEGFGPVRVEEGYGQGRTDVTVHCGGEQYAEMVGGIDLGDGMIA